MQNQTSNPCIRCGKERIVVRTWQEQSGGSTLTYTTMSCSDESCQKIVDQQLAAQKEKSDMAKISREQRKFIHQKKPK